jgi:hypothetical protein
MKRTPAGAAGRLGAALGLATAGLLAGACFGGGACDFESLECAAVAGAPSPAAPPVDAPVEGRAVEGRVYLDLSTSMRGFVADERSPLRFTPLQEALDHLLAEAFAGAEIGGVEHDGFGDAIRRNVGPLQGFAVQAPGGPSPRERFAEPSTDLVQAFRDAAAHPDALSVVVTDGVQDLRRSGDDGVGPGFIRTAMVRELERGVIDRGFGLWLVGVMSPFDGCYFNVNPDPQGRVNQCMRVEARPVLFWILSRDLTAGRRFVQSVAEGLRRPSPPAAAGVARPEVQALEVWPGAVPEPRLEVTRGTELGREFFTDNLFVGAWLPSAALTAPRGVTAACVTFERRAGGLLRVPLQLRSPIGRNDSASVPVLPGSFWRAVVPEASEWRLVELAAGAADSAAGAAGAEPRPDGGDTPWALEIAHEAAARLAGEGRTLEIPLRLRLSLDFGPEDFWLRRWSTADDSSAAAVEGKTLYLWDVVGGVVTAAAGDREPVACLQLKFKRR